KQCSNRFDQRRLPSDFARRRAGDTSREFADRQLFPFRRMPPRMGIVEEEIGGVECRPLRTSERKVFERSPTDEQAAGSGMNESEVAHPRALYDSEFQRPR